LYFEEIDAIEARVQDLEDFVRTLNMHKTEIERQIQGPQGVSK